MKKKSKTGWSKTMTGTNASNKEQSSENPDRVETFNRRADAKREGYVRANFDESVTEGETERKYGPD